MLGWAERRGAGLIQDRPGPNRVGPFGLLQLPVDAVKFFFKEDVIPTKSDRVLYVLAPGIAVFSALTTAAAGVILSSSSLRLPDIVLAQERLWLGFFPRWNVVPQFLGFVVFFVSTFAETNRVPFDLPEADAELVGGYHTEYSAMKFAMFMMAEYVNIVVACALTVTLFFGGWSLPGFHPQGVGGAILSI